MNNLTLGGWSIQPSGLHSLSFALTLPRPLTSIQLDLVVSNSLDNDATVLQYVDMSTATAPNLIEARAPNTCSEARSDGKRSATSAAGDAIPPSGKMAAGFTILTPDPVSEALNSLLATSDSVMRYNYGDSMKVDELDDVLMNAVVKALTEMSNDKDLMAAVSPKPRAVRQAKLDYREDAFLLGLSDAEAQRMIHKGDKVCISTTRQVRRAFCRDDVAQGIAMETQRFHGEHLVVARFSDDKHVVYATMSEKALVRAYLQGNDMAGGL